MIDDQLKKGSTHTLILAVLETAPLHGYAIAREIESRSKDALKMNEGSLYPALRSLEREGFIVGTWETQESGPARRVYTLTESGHGELAEKRARWQSFSEAVNGVLGDPFPGGRNNVPQPA
ncbi:MAG: PadR family transcriptional regulator [Akkermansiaceae bacterium]|nr:PadR family transcriptional regulator [Armatimonadota bacterium]